MTDDRASIVAGMQVTNGVSLLEPLSSGGMGAVWLADHRGLKTHVVVKFMLGELGASESARARFSREAAAAAQVKSPHVVQMLDHGVTDSGVPFIVMEHLEGRDLGDELDEHGPLDPAKAVAVVTQVAKALAKVHAAGLLHRDIKPDNIFLCAGEDDVFVKLLDFGIVKSQASVDASDSLDSETKTGQVVGTPFYMSPEQVTAQKTIDHRSDLWSLGVVTYQALTGVRPYDGPSFGALAVKIATGDPPKPSLANPSLPAAFDAWFAKACARDPAERFSSAKEMVAALQSAFDAAAPLMEGVREPSPLSSSGSSGARIASLAAPAARLGLATTTREDSDVVRSLLARSEAGLALGSGRPPVSARSSPLLFAGGGVLVAALGGALLFWSRAEEPVNTAKTATASSAEPRRPPARAGVHATKPEALADRAPVARDASPSYGDASYEVSAAHVGSRDAGAVSPVVAPTGAVASPDPAAPKLVEAGAAKHTPAATSAGLASSARPRASASAAPAPAASPASGDAYDLF